jgi:hypothetical protein
MFGVGRQRKGWGGSMPMSKCGHQRWLHLRIHRGSVLKKQLALLATLVAICVSVLAIAPVSSAAPPTATLGNVTGTTASGGTFTGTLSNVRFVNQNGVLTLVGNLTGTLTNAAGTVIGSVTNQAISTPVTGAAAAGSCSILDLTLGPLHLNLLGLVVDLNQVHLQITGQTGPGQLLGNLLCGLANALNGGGGGLANILNRLLGL